ncbi:hypothetical protein TNCV_4459671 [Trichonephila clavipes]|nr:hypothetical protein TNCV_4459671 [Trichonephila clavipes]
MLYCCCFLCHLISTASYPGPRNSSWQGARCTPVVGRSLEHHADDISISLGSTLVLRENTLGGSGDSHFSSLSTNLTRGLVVRRLCRVPPYNKCTLHLQTSKPFPGFVPRSYGTVISIANRCNGWVTNASLTHDYSRRVFSTPQQQEKPVFQKECAES